jgi:CRP-like cAMP-binding protein
VKLLLLAAMWGCVSAVSLPLGAVVGLWARPSQKVTSTLMAFGGGSLLFALTLELFGHALHQSHAGKDDWIIITTMIGAVVGGLIFAWLNQLLNNKGGHLRRGALIKKHIEKSKRRQARMMIKGLSKVKILHALPPEEIIELIPYIMTSTFSAGQTIFRQGDSADRLFFIVSGRVEVLREDGQRSSVVAELSEGDTFGEIALISDNPRTATVRAVTEVTAWTLLKVEFEHLLQSSPLLQERCRQLVSRRLSELEAAHEVPASEARTWAAQAMENFDRVSIPLTGSDIEHEVDKHGGSAAMAIWMGIALDGIPESLVIGMLVTAAATTGTSISLALIGGVFMANLPEAMSSAVTLQRQGAGFAKIFWMWMSLCIMTGLGALLGAWIFPAHPTGGLAYLVSGLEGIAAGAMLTMIAETMLPEAFEQGGGSGVGLSTLAGFLATLAVKLVGG